jgi:hypothetical protein
MDPALGANRRVIFWLSEYKMAGWRGYLGLVGFEVPIDLLLSPSGGVYRLWNMILC